MSVSFSFSHSLHWGNPEDSLKWALTQRDPERCTLTVLKNVLKIFMSFSWYHNEQ